MTILPDPDLLNYFRPMIAADRAAGLDDATIRRKLLADHRRVMREFDPDDPANDPWALEWLALECRRAIDHLTSGAGEPT